MFVDPPRNLHIAYNNKTYANCDVAVVFVDGNRELQCFVNGRARGTFRWTSVPPIPMTQSPATTCTRRTDGVYTCENDVVISSGASPEEEFTVSCHAMILGIETQTCIKVCFGEFIEDSEPALHIIIALYLGTSYVCMYGHHASLCVLM